MQSASPKPGGVRRKGKSTDNCSEDSRHLAQSGSRKRVRFAAKEGDVSLSSESSSSRHLAPESTSSLASGESDSRRNGLTPQGPTRIPDCDLITGPVLREAIDVDEHRLRPLLPAAGGADSFRDIRASDFRAHDAECEVGDAPQPSCNTMQDSREPRPEDSSMRASQSEARVSSLRDRRMNLEPLTLPAAVSQALLERRPAVVPSASASRSQSFDDTIMREVEDLVARMPKMKLERSRSNVEILMKRRQLLGTYLGTPKSGTSPKLPRTKSF